MPEHFTDRFADDKRRPGICRGRRLIDQHKIFAPEILQKPCRRINNQRGSRHNHKICAGNRFYSAKHDGLIERFLIQDNIRFDAAAARAVGDGVAVKDVLGRIEFMAALTIIAQHTAVQFIDHLLPAF